MLIEAIVISLIIGLIRGGKLRRFKMLSNKAMWVLIFGILLQYALVFLSRIEEVGSISKILSYTKEISIISYILILIGIVTNLKFRSLWAVLIGFIGNFLAFAMNNWKIPILLEGIQLTNTPNLMGIVESGNAALYTPITEAVKYPILGDIIIFPKFYPVSRIISLGDLIISFGIFALIQEIMLAEDSFMGGYRL